MFLHLGNGAVADTDDIGGRFRYGQYYDFQAKPPLSGNSAKKRPGRRYF